MEQGGRDRARPHECLARRVAERPRRASACSALAVDTGAAARAYCPDMSSHLEHASGKSRLGSRRKGRPATVVACERRNLI